MPHLRARHGLDSLWQDVMNDDRAIGKLPAPWYETPPELRGPLAQALLDLTHREQRAIACYYGLHNLPPLTLNETGFLIGPVTPERVRQIILKAIRRLRWAPRRQRFAVSQIQDAPPYPTAIETR